MANLPLDFQTLNLPVPIILSLPVPTLVQPTLGQTIIIGGGNIFPTTDASTSVSRRTFTSLSAPTATHHPASSTTSQAPPSESSTVTAGAESTSHLLGLSSGLPSPSTTSTTDTRTQKKGKKMPIAPKSQPTPNTGASLPPLIPPPNKSIAQTAQTQRGTPPSNYRVISIAIPILVVVLLLVGALAAFIMIRRCQRRRKVHSHVSSATHAIPYNVRTNYPAGFNQEKTTPVYTALGAGRANSAALVMRFDAMEQRMRSLEASGVRMSDSDVENTEMDAVNREMNFPPPNYSPATSDHSSS
ncbi:hypothetical protein CPC08DRAFT_709739 [Agrocybe pediades]|nr:hypothetical protein CPC08DRAFT_709739 [Agrocybe pediades]